MRHTFASLLLLSATQTHPERRASQAENRGYCHAGRRVDGDAQAVAADRRRVQRHCEQHAAVSTVKRGAARHSRTARGAIRICKRRSGRDDLNVVAHRNQSWCRSAHFAWSWRTLATIRSVAAGNQPLGSDPGY